MATNFTYATLTTAIQNYTEVTDTTNVFTSTITDGAPNPTDNPEDFT